MTATKRDTAKMLADAHRQGDPQTNIIKFFPSAPGDRVHLLEVSGSAPTTGDVLPYGFGSAPQEGIHYPSVVILLSPEEWEQVNEDRLELPEGWDLSLAEDV